MHGLKYCAVFQEELLNGERASWREVITILSPGRSALSHGGGGGDDIYIMMQCLSLCL